MNLIDFTEKYPNEAACKDFFKTLRIAEGIKCKKCDCKEHYWKKDKDVFECKKCHFRTSLRSGTVMEGSHLPYRYWLLAIHLMTSTKKSISALEMQRQLGHKYYEPIWAMMHKIRLMMGKRDEGYLLTETVELDEGFFEQVKEPVIDELTGKKEDKKRGRGSQKQAKVLVMASTEPIETYEKHSKPSKFRFVKMSVLEDLTAKSIEKEVKKSIDPKATAKTDGFRSYSQLKNIVSKHIQQVVPKEKVNTVLPWVHTMISNAKRSFAGTYHMIKNEYMQNYLNEFCYKTNRRYFQDKVFERLLIACVSEPWYK